MQSLDRNGLSAETVKKALHGPHRRFSFRYELQDKDLRKIGDLHTVKDGEVRQDAFATIKRTASFSLIDTGEIDFLNDRIKPYVQLLVNGQWVDFPQGVYLLSSPKKKDIIGSIERNIDAFDGLLILQEDKFETRYRIAAGISYYQAIIGILESAGIELYNIENTDKTLPVEKEFEAGKEKLLLINELLREINYTPLHVNADGVYTSYTYRSPAVRSVDYTYQDDSESVTFPGVEEELDLTYIPNKWVVVRTNAEEEPLFSVYTNDNQDSITSTVNRNRTIVDYREITDIADQNSLDAYTQRIAFEASQVYGKVDFETGIMPMHDYADVIELNYSLLGITGKYSETSWSLPLRIDGRMKHSLRRVVSI
jgi:hypothetical protein